MAGREQQFGAYGQGPRAAGSRGSSEGTERDVSVRIPLPDEGRIERATDTEVRVGDPPSRLVPPMAMHARRTRFTHHSTHGGRAMSELTKHRASRLGRTSAMDAAARDDAMRPAGKKLVG